MPFLYSLIRPYLFRMDAEEVHELTLSLLTAAGEIEPVQAALRAVFTVEHPSLEVEAFGVKFKNRVGLAGGWDKNAVAVRGLAALGFGHLEVGTVTMLPQEGLPRPRIHRIPQHEALINRMGFPNHGVDALQIPPDVRRLTRLGINIGKGKDTPLDKAVDDYCGLLERVYDQADYVSLNISSPNTVGLRDLQARSFIESLLRAVTDLRDSLQPRVPLLVKIAPDMAEADIDAVLEAIDATGVDGLIATNATVDRTGMPDFAVKLEGGLSGPPVRAMSTAVVRYVAQRTNGRLPIIGVGGVGSPDDALEKLDAGATLVQVNTGLVYGGPNLIKRINLRLLREAAPRSLNSSHK